MRRVAIPADVEKLDNWLQMERHAYFEKIQVEANTTGKTTPRDYEKKWKEWWTLREVVKSPVGSAIFGVHFVAEHMDGGKGGPDFVLHLSDGSLVLEVTEATTQEDRKAIKKGRLVNECYSIGALGGRGKDGGIGDVSEGQVAADISEAIKRKKKIGIAGVRHSLSM